MDGKRGESPVKTLKDKLQNPYALVAQGFLAGGLLFVATRADAAALISAFF